MRYSAEEEKGMKYAKEIAQASREWAGNALRKVDMEAWLFRVFWSTSPPNRSVEAE